MADIKVKATADSTGYRRGIKEMQQANGEMGKSVTSVGDIIKGTFAGQLLARAATSFSRSIVGMVKQAIAMGSELTDVAFQTDLSISALQKLESASKRAGIPFDKTTSAIIRMKRAQGDALDGNKELAKSFERLGVTAEKLETMTTEELFDQISKAFIEGGRSGRDLNAVMDIMGRNSGQLQEVLDQTANGIANVTSRFGEMSEEAAHANDAFGDLADELGTGILRKVGEGWGMIANELMYQITGVDEAAKRMNDEAINRNKMEEARRQQVAERRKQREADELAKKAADDLKASERAKEERQKLEEQYEKAGRQPIKPDTNRIREMGGFAGGVESDRLQAVRRQISIQEKQAEILKQIEENTKQSGALL